MPTTAVAEKKTWPKWENQKPLEKKDYMKYLMDKLAPDFDLLLQKRMDPNVLIFAVLNSFNKTPKLAECSLKSIMRSIVYLAQIQLMPDTPDQHAHLIPYGGQCTVITNYRGYIELAHRTNRVNSITGHLVHENDEFHLQYGSDPKLDHVPAQGERGKIIGAYARAKLANGEVQFEYMNWKELEKIRNSSPSKDRKDSPWKKWPEEMYKKCPIRRLHKFIPSSPAMSMAVALDNTATTGDSQDDLTPIPASFNILEDEDDGNGSSRQSKSDKVADDLDDKSEKPEAKPPEKETKKEKPAQTKRSKRTDPKRTKETKSEPPAKADPPVADRKQREAEFLSYLVEHETAVKTFQVSPGETYNPGRVAELSEKGLAAAFGYIKTNVEDYYAKHPKQPDEQQEGQRKVADF